VTTWARVPRRVDPLVIAVEGLCYAGKTTLARREVARYLADCPATDDAVVIVNWPLTPYSSLYFVSVSRWPPSAASGPAACAV
jgi:hypothetical protein